MSILTGENLFEGISLKIDDPKTPEDESKKKPDEGGSPPPGGDAESGEKTDDGVTINDDSPDANGDGEVNADDDLNGDGIVDAKDLKIAELQKELQVRQLEKEIESLDDPAWDPQQMVVNRLRIKDRGDKFVCINQRGQEVKEFPYDNKQTSSREARYQAQRYVEGHLDDQVTTKHTASKEDEVNKEKEENPENNAKDPDGSIGDPTPGKGTEAGNKGEESKQKANAPDPKKKKAVKEDMNIMERRKFIYACRMARDMGKPRFEFAGKMYDTRSAKVMADEEVQVMVDQIKEWMGAGLELEEAVNKLISEAGYNNFPLTREEWMKRLPMLAKNMQNVHNPGAKGTSNAQYVTLADRRLAERALLEGKIDAKTLKTLRSLDADEARMIIQGLPKSVRASALKSLGLKEKVDGRTKAYKETANRLLAYKQKREGLEEAKDEKKPAVKEDPKAKKDIPDEATDGDIDGGEKAALAALEKAKKELTSKYGYSDDDLGGSPAKSGGDDASGDEKSAAPKGKEEKPVKGEEPPAKEGSKADAKADAEKPGDKEASPQQKAEDPEAAAMDADNKKLPEPDMEGDEVEDYNGDGMNDEHEMDHAEEGGEFSDIDAKLDQIQMAVDQILQDQDMEEPQVRKGVGPSGKEEYDVVQGQKTLANGFDSAEEALTWIERNRESVMGPEEGEMGATEGEEDMVAGDGKMVSSVAGKSSKPIPGKEPTPNDGKVTPTGADEKKPVPTGDKKPKPDPKGKPPMKESVDMYADFLSSTKPSTSVLSEAWYGTRKPKTTTRTVKKTKDDGLSKKIQAHQKSNPGVGTARSRMIAKGYIKADMDDLEQISRESTAISYGEAEDRPLEEVRGFKQKGTPSSNTYSAKDIKMAIGIATDPRYKGGNMTGATKAIEKIKSGLSGHKQVAAVLRRVNEEEKPEDRKPTVQEVYAAALSKFFPK